MNIAFVGCGYVADYYMETLPLHPELILTGVMDRDPARSKNFSEFYKVPIYETLDELLSDPKVDIVLNLTNPRSHYEISKAALDAGKHVYSEKPLGMDINQAKELVKLAESKGLLMVSAPCNLLGEAAQTFWKKLRENVVGKVRLVYAEMDDAMIHKMPYKEWRSESGTPWPYKDEFEIGCTLEHAGYYLSWLAAFFGPAKSVTSFASIQIPDKLPDETLNMQSPDFSVACIQFHSGVVARLTSSIVAPHDHSLKVIGDTGILCTKDAWFYNSPVYSRKLIKIRRRVFYNPIKTRYKLLKANTPEPPEKGGALQMDFARGVAELAASVRENRPCRLSPQFTLHINEMALAIHHANVQGGTYNMTTTFDAVEPMEWAK